RGSAPACLRGGSFSDGPASVRHHRGWEHSHCTDRRRDAAGGAPGEDRHALCRVLSLPRAETTSRPLINALERVGLILGRSLVWDIGGVVFSEDQIVVEAQRLVARRPDLILIWPGNVAAARAAKDATRTIPIVLMAVPDAVENGLVDS